MKKILIISTLFFFALAVGAVAGNYHHYSGCGMFSTKLSDMDPNGDGTVTLEEFNDYMAAGHKGIFDALDTNKDSLIDDDEWTTFIEAHSYGSMKKGAA